MNIQEALVELQLDYIPSLEILKKQYHKMALIHHPDKNGNTVESKEKFQQIGEAYEIIKREISILDEIDDPMSESNDNTGYSYFMNLFIDGILLGKYNEILLPIIKYIVSGAKKISLKLFEHIDKERMIYIYNFLFKYKDILRFEKEELDLLQSLISEKYKDVQIYIVRPTLVDLFENNIYVLKHQETLYYVPLWHSELVFDIPNTDGEIIVKCNPTLPDHISIDENNNLLVTVYIPFTYSLLNKEYETIIIGPRRLCIPLSKLLCKRVQNYVFKGQGISRICHTDMYNVDDISDIIVKVIFQG